MMRITLTVFVTVASIQSGVTGARRPSDRHKVEQRWPDRSSTLRSNGRWNG